tara:strand:+ start:75 stop:386 length:312 start_codon:yes stop_codon:yes gene_type:complete
MSEAKKKIVDTIESLIINPNMLDEWKNSDGCLPGVIADKIDEALDDYLLSVLPQEKITCIFGDPDVEDTHDEDCNTCSFNTCLKEIKKNAGIKELCKVVHMLW